MISQLKFKEKKEKIKEKDEKIIKKYRAMSVPAHVKEQLYDKTWKEYKRYHDDYYIWKKFRQDINSENIEFNIVKCPSCSNILDIRFTRICPICDLCPCGYNNCRHKSKYQSIIPYINKYSFTPINNSIILNNNERKNNRIIIYIYKELCDEKNQWRMMSRIERLQNNCGISESLDQLHIYTSLEQVACRLYELLTLRERIGLRINVSMCNECGLGPINLSGNKCQLCKHVNNNYNLDGSLSTNFNKWDGSLSTLFVAPIISELCILCILATKCNLPTDVYKIIIKNLTKDILYDQTSYFYSIRTGFMNHDSLTPRTGIQNHDSYTSSCCYKKDIYNLVKPMNKSYNYEQLDERDKDELWISSEDSECDYFSDDGWAYD